LRDEAAQAVERAGGKLANGCTGETVAHAAQISSLLAALK
jgi:hypothetical protein